MLTRNDEVDGFDLVRMKEALEAEAISVPPGLSREEVRELILSVANSK